MSWNSIVRAIAIIALLVLGATAEGRAARSVQMTVVVPNFAGEALDMSNPSAEDLQCAERTNEPLIGAVFSDELSAEHGLSGYGSAWQPEIVTKSE